MRVRWFWIGGVALACAFAGCVDLSKPTDGVFSLSDVQLPSPGVVMKDTMRDSTGQVAPLHAVAYGADGDSIPATVSFIVVDSGAHTVGPLLIGDTVRSLVHVIASTDAIQTRPVTFEVTLSPDTIVPNDSTVHHTAFSVLSGDSVATSAALTALVEHFGVSDTTAVNAVIVRYAITRAPPDNGHGPSVLLMNGSVPSDRDTTSLGMAARSLRLRILALSNLTADTAVVTATASYRGQSIGTVEFTVVFTSP